MKRASELRLRIVLSIAAITLAGASQADFELTAPDGRRVMLKDNGTWAYVQPDDNNRPTDAPPTEGEALLALEGTTPRGKGCLMNLSLENRLPYEIRSFVPYFSVYRDNGTLYDTVSGTKSFNALKPGDKQTREVEFAGIPCKEIGRVKVVGGDRCQMGDLDRFSATSEQCLAKVRVVESKLLRFDK